MAVCTAINVLCKWSNSGDRILVVGFSGAITEVIGWCNRVRGGAGTNIISFTVDFWSNGVRVIEASRWYSISKASQLVKLERINVDKYTLILYCRGDGHTIWTFVCFTLPSFFIIDSFFYSWLKTMAEYPLLLLRKTIQCLTLVAIKLGTNWIWLINFVILNFRFLLSTHRAKLRSYAQSSEVTLIQC
mgnify:CR=1 FL=1